MINNNSLNWKHVFNSIKDSIVLLDTNGLIKDCNEAFHKLVNKSSTQIIGYECFKIIFGRTDKLKNCPFLRSKKSKKRESITIEKDNKWFKIDVAPILDENNRVSGFVLFMLDITERELTENLLKKEKEYYHTFVTSLNDWVWEMNLKGFHTYSNPAVESVLGYKVAEVVGHHVTKLWVDSDKQNNYSKISEKALSKGKGWKHAVGRFQHKNGSIITTESSATPIYNSEKKIIGYRGVDHDITERIKAELALRESEKKYKDLFEKSKDAILIIHNGKFVDCNQTTVKMLRYNNKTEFLNTHPSKLSPEKQPDGKMSFTKADEMMRIAYEKGSHRFEWNHKKSDGEIFPVEVLLTTISSDEENLILHTVWRDITERKKAELALQKSEERFKQLVENASDIIYRLDAKGYLTYVNPVTLKMGNYTKKDLIGKKYLKLIPKEYYHEVKRYFINQSIKKIENTYKEFPVKTKSGSYVWLGQNVQLLFEKDKIVGFQAVARDITKRREAEEALRNGRERLKILNKIIRHDLANDFIVIKSAINIFRRTSNTKMINEMESRVDKSLRTIEKYKKYESVIDFNTDLDELEIIELLNELIVEFPKIKFKIEGECTVLADDALNSIFTNLITNSIQHGKASEIDVKISTENNMCEIKFMDNGTGIPDKIKDKIFDEGFSHGKAGQTGIGLYIVKKTIESYGGSISVENNKPNGAVFKINLKKVL